VATLPARRVIAVLLAMGFQPVLDQNQIVTYLRRDTKVGVCVVTFDIREEDVWQEQLIQYLDLHQINLAEFWNLYDTTPDA
jgi:hypothetical protein